MCTASGLNVSFVGIGTCTLTAQVAAGTDYRAASGSPQSFSVGQGQTTTGLSSPTNPSVSGQKFTVTATVGVDAPSTGSPVGSVTFSFSGSGTLPTCSSGHDTVTLSGGQATCTVSAQSSQSPLTVNAGYNGSTDFASSNAIALSQTIDQAATAVALSASPDPGVSGESVTFTGAVTAKAPGSGTPSGSADWTITSEGGTTVPCSSTASRVSGSTLDETCTVSAGTLVVSGSPYAVAVSYLGDANFTGSTASMSEQVQGTSTTKVKVSTSGSSATLTAKVKGSPAGTTPTGTVTFTVTTKHGAVVNCNRGNLKALNSAGKATCSLQRAERGELALLGDGDLLGECRLRPLGVGPQDVHRLSGSRDPDRHHRGRPLRRRRSAHTVAPMTTSAPATAAQIQATPAPPLEGGVVVEVVVTIGGYEVEVVDGTEAAELVWKATTRSADVANRSPAPSEGVGKWLAGAPTMA